MPLPLVDKIHFTFDPAVSTLPAALTEARDQVAGLAGFTMTAVEFEDGTIIDIDAFPVCAPLNMRLHRRNDNTWVWSFIGPNGEVSADTTNVESALNEVLAFIAANGGPDLDLHERHTGDDI